MQTRHSLLFFFFSLALMTISPQYACGQDPGGQICSVCRKSNRDCSYKGNHPKCQTCGKVIGAITNTCPHNGNHPEPTPVPTTRPASHTTPTTSSVYSNAVITMEGNSMVLFANYDNRLRIHLSDVDTNHITATMTEGTILSKGNGIFIARPTRPGSEVTITLSAARNGQMQEIGIYKYRVLKLIDPTAFIAYTADGVENRFKGGGLSKQILMETEGISAAIDNGLLNIAFRVNSFETVFYDAMGNAVPYESNGANFSDQQKAQMRGLARNKRFYITDIRVTGPDGIERTLDGVMQVIVK